VSDFEEIILPHMYPPENSFTQKAPQRIIARSVSQEKHGCYKKKKYFAYGPRKKADSRKVCLSLSFESHVTSIKSKI